MRITLNLLPPPNKAALRTGFITAYAQSMLIIFLVMTVFASGTLIAVNVLIRSTYEDLAKRSTSGTIEYQALSDEIRKINLYLQRIDALHKSYTPWSDVLSAITEVVPDGTQIDRLRIDSKGGISLGGVALTRDDVLLLGQRLEKSGMFKNIQSPLSNILQQKDVKFDFEMTYVRPQP